MSACPLCHSSNRQNINCQLALPREYYYCAQCEFVQMNPEQWPSNNQEFQRYSLHQNIVDEGYVHFFKPLVKIVKELQNPKDVGLDFGCGPIPAGESYSVLAQLLQQNDFRMECFDPLFKQNYEAIKYDFITLTEVIEHVQDPMKLILDLKSNLKSTSGRLYLMTSPFLGLDQFEKWPYRRDFTHISFFNKKNLRLLFEKVQMKMLIEKENLFVFEAY